MTTEDAIRVLREQKKTYEYNLKESPSAEYTGQASRSIFESKIKAIVYAIDALELIGKLEDRPCDYCEEHEEKGCRVWSCVFDKFLFGERYGGDNG